MGEVIHGDCLEVLREMEAESVDAVVCDPPYFLTFMGREWDNGGTPQEQQEAHGAWTREAFRVLKPGGHLVAFGGTRTYHRLACAIEDAGFEIRDSLHWVYGCVDEDTEVMVDGEWKRHHDLRVGQRALCYDVTRRCYTWQPIQEVYIYDHDGPAYRITGDRTNQVVSPNHRCIVERGGVPVFEYAGDVARQREASIPVLEGVRDLLDALPLPDEGAGDAQSDVLAGMYERGFAPSAAEAPASGATTRHGEGEMCDLRGGVLAGAGMGGEGESELLLQSMQREGAGEGASQALAQIQGGVDGQVAGLVSEEDDRPEQPIVEGRRYLLPQARQLQANQVREMSAGVHGDGSQGRVCDGAPLDCGGAGGAVPGEGGGGPPHQPRPAGQQAGEPDAVPDEQGAQAVRGERFTRSDVGRFKRIHYRGIMWCIRTPTGAFVARRRGRAFITGNSGFPKSHDVSKAIDKAAGAEREVVGVREDFAARANKLRRGVSWADCDIEDGSFSHPEQVGQITAPATDAAKQWDGWGTALKPSHEPIVLARKPLIGTVAENVLAHGCGGLNVDGCRVGVDDGTRNRPPSKPSSATYAQDEWTQNPDNRKPFEAQGSGRWPPNFALSHHPECEQVGVKRVRGSDRPGHDGRKAETSGDIGRFTDHMHSTTRHAAPDGTETVPDMKCHPSCPVKALGEMSGESTSQGIAKFSGHTTYRWSKSHPKGTIEPQHGMEIGRGDTGTAARFFPCFRYQAKASTAERNWGLDNLPRQGGGDGVARNSHPT